MCQAHVVADIAYHKRVQSNGFDPQHGGVMTSMHLRSIARQEMVSSLTFDLLDFE